MPNATEVTVKLSRDLKEKVEREILWRCRQVVTDSSDRDEILLRYVLQASGLSQPYNTNYGGNGGCQLDDPLTMEQCMKLAAHLVAQYRSGPFVTLEASEAEGEETAAKVEAALTVKTKQWGLVPSLQDAAHNAVRLPFAPVQINWEQELKKVRKAVQIDVATGEEVDDDAVQLANEPNIDPTDPLRSVAENAGVGVQYPETITRQEAQYEVVSDGPKWRVISPDDYYHYPSFAQTPLRAYSVIERMWIMPEELVEGIGTHGYDPDIVMNMIHGANRGLRDGILKDQLENDGITIDSCLFECFQVTGRMPLIYDDTDSIKIETPEYLRDEDFVWMCCPAFNAVFKFVSFPYTRRNYVIFRVDRIPNMLMGRCVPSLVEPYQEELTAGLRLKIDVANQMSDPTLIVDEDMYDQLQGHSAEPGMLLKRGTGGRDPVPLQWDLRIVPMLTQQYGENLNRVSQFMASGQDQIATGNGAGPVGGPPTATQVNAASASSAMLRDQFSDNFAAGVVEAYEIILAQWAQHADENGETVMVNKQPTELAPSDISAKFQIFANANSMNSNPQVRQQQTMAKIQIQMGFFQQMQTQPPNLWTYFYHGARRALEDMGERNVEAWIGKEPNPADPAMALNEIAQVMMQAQQQMQTPEGQAQPMGSLVQAITGILQETAQAQQPQQAPQGMDGGMGGQVDPMMAALSGGMGGQSLHIGPPQPSMNGVN